MFVHLSYTRVLLGGVPKFRLLAGRQHRIINVMNPERTIAEIEWLEQLYALPDTRPLQLSDLYAANQRHDETYADNPWFRLWKRYGI